MAYSLVDRGFTRKHRRVVRVSPTLDISGSMTDNNVLFRSTEIPNAVSDEGGCSVLRGISILQNKNLDQDMDLVFTQVQVHPSAAVNQTVANGDYWTPALAESAKILGHVWVDMSANDTDLIDNILFTINSNTVKWGNRLFLQAEPGSTSVYFFGVDRTGGISYALNAGIHFAFHIEY